MGAILQVSLGYEKFHDYFFLIHFCDLTIILQHTQVVWRIQSSLSLEDSVIYQDYLID